MEAYLPGPIGLLTALAVWVLLGSGSGEGRSRAHLPGASLRDRLADGVLGLADAIGARVPAALVAQPLVAACAQELVRCGAPVLGRHHPTGSTAFGVLVLGEGAAALAGLVVSGSLAGAGAGALVLAGWCAARAVRQRRARAERIETGMPEAFHGLSISLGSGHSLAQALRFVGNHAQDPVRTEFMRASCALACGVSAADALDGLLARLPAPGLDLVALALKVSQRTGAPLSELLEQASGMVGERIELARSLEVKTAQARLSARLVALMPAAMIAVLTLLSPDFRAGLATPAGAGSVAAALALNVCALMVIRRIMEVRL